MLSQYVIPDNLAAEIESVADRMGKDPVELLETLVRQFLGRYKLMHSANSERRAFLRMSVSIPAVVYVEEEDGAVRYQSALIKDVSPCGIRLVCASRKRCGQKMAGSLSGVTFEIIFAYAEGMEPIRFKCEIQRVEEIGDDLHVGASILRTSPEGQRLYDQLLDSLGLSAGTYGI